MVSETYLFLIDIDELHCYLVIVLPLHPYMDTLTAQ